MASASAVATAVIKWADGLAVPSVTERHTRKRIKHLIFTFSDDGDDGFY